MKTLYESILDDNVMDKIQDEKFAIKEWINDHNILNDHTSYKVGSDGLLRFDGDKYIILTYDNYDELPYFIKIADDPGLTIRIGSTYARGRQSVDWQMDGIKSFVGLPKVANTLNINNIYAKSKKDVALPPLKIKLKNSMYLGSGIADYGGLEVEFMPNQYKYGKYVSYVKFGGQAPLKNIYIKGVNEINLVNDFNLGDKFSKAIARKAEMNKHKMVYETPITEAGLQVVKTFFDGTIDLDSVNVIEYTQNSKLEKHNGQWYRFKNW